MRVNLQLFGGRGASSGGGGTSVTSVSTQSGVDADLSENPLVYSDSGSTMTDAQRQAIEAQELKRLNAKIEFSYTVDKDGNVIGQENKGGASGVHTPTMDLDYPDAAFTHNHPRSPNNPGEKGVIGGTFSPTDVSTFTTTNVKNFRASAHEGTYSITKKANFDGKGLRDYYKQVSDDARKKYQSKHSAIKSDYQSGKLNWSGYLHEHSKIFNGMMVEQHNALLAGQSKYGYSYGLEAR